MVKIRAKGFDEVEFEGVPLEEYEKLKKEMEELSEINEKMLRFLYRLYDDLEDMLRGEDE